MTTVFIEARPKGRPEGSPIEDYVIEEAGDRVLKTFRTQEEAITWAKGAGHSPHVARVRHLNDKDKPDHWRRVYPHVQFSQLRLGEKSRANASRQLYQWPAARHGRQGPRRILRNVS